MLHDQEKLLKKSIPLIKPSKYTSIGEMHYLKWRKSYELLKKYELLTEEFNVTEAYTTEFLR